MALVIVAIIGGLSLGGFYCLISLGLVLAFRATGTINFAHGELMVVPAFTAAWWEAHHHGAVAIGLLLGVVVVSLICLAFYLTILQRLAGASEFIPVIATFGLASILDGLIIIVFGSNDYILTIPSIPTGHWVWFGVGVSQTAVTWTLITFGVALVIAGCLRFTHFGRLVSVTGQDALLAGQSGIPVRRIHAISWILAGILAAIAGYSYGSQNIVQFSMTGLALAGFPAILLGGMDSIAGALVGGLIVGLVQGFTTTYLGGNYVNLVTYLLLLAVLMVRPRGLFGRQRVVRL